MHKCMLPLSFTRPAGLRSMYLLHTLAHLTQRFQVSAHYIGPKRNETTRIFGCWRTLRRGLTNATEKNEVPGGFTT